MRIAILGSRGFPSTYGGYETMVRELAPEWVDRGHEVTVYCRHRSRGRRAWVEGGVRCVWTPGLDSKSASTLTFGMTSALHASSCDFDAALVLNVANGFWLPLLEMSGIPTVLNTDGLEWERGKWGPAARAVFRTAARLAARSATVLVSDSKEIGRVWRARFGVSSKFIPYGGTVPEAAIGSGRLDAAGLEPGAYLLVVARLIPENNVDLFLDALMLRQRDSLVPVVVGSANYDSETERRLAALDRTGAVRWLGHVSDQDLLTQLWAHCAMYVHGHSVGGTNPALVQAMALGAPVLALDTPFSREVLGRGAEDQLYPRDPASLARLLDRAAQSSDWRGSLVERQSARVASDYTWAAVSQSYLEALAGSIELKQGRAG